MLDASWPANGVHDAYLACVDGAGVLCSVARQDAASPSVSDGLYKAVRSNAAAIGACRTGPATSIACAANQCTHVGAFRISSVAGRVRCDFSAGQNRECGIWNKDNQITGVLKVTQPNGTSVLYNNPYGNGYVANGFSPVGNDPNNSAKVLSGWIDGNRVHIDLILDHRGLQDGTSNTAYRAGIGWNSTTAECGNPSGAAAPGPYPGDSMGPAATMNIEFANPNSNYGFTLNSWCEPPPFAGVATVTAVESQIWYNGQEWLSPDDWMLRVRFAY